MGKDLIQKQKGQVPMKTDSQNQKILIVGNGRLSLHLRYYLTARRIPWHLWTRNESSFLLQELVPTSTLACLAVSDGAIEEVAATLPEELTKIHFSGLHVSRKAKGIHPLMTFGPQLLAADVYDRIPLVVDEEAQSLSWLKTLPNPLLPIRKEDKALYHGLCHLAGNYPKLLWEEIAQVFEEHLHLPRKFLQLYLEQVLSQVMKKETDLEAGPFGRKDEKTIQTHLLHLESFPELKSSYLQFYRSYHKKEVPNDLA